MQEDGLEEFWWDEFVALTVGRKEGRWYILSSLVQSSYVIGNSGHGTLSR